MIDLTFVKELDSSGFIDGLYRAQPVVAGRSEPRPLPESAVVKEKVSRAKRLVSNPLDDVVLPQKYTVVTGDTLGHLALRFYGLSTKWPQIQQGNADTLKNPHYLYIGQELLIPPDSQAGK